MCLRFGSGEVNSWADIWNQGLNLLPADMLEVMNGIGVAELLGLTTSTLWRVHKLRCIAR